MIIYIYMRRYFGLFDWINTEQVAQLHSKKKQVNKFELTWNTEFNNSIVSHQCQS